MSFFHLPPQSFLPELPPSFLGVIITFGKRGHISQGASIKADISSVTDDIAAPRRVELAAIAYVSECCRRKTS